MSDKHPDEYLQNAILLAEIGLDLKERCTTADKFINHLKMLFTQAKSTIDSLHSSARYSLLQARRLLVESPTTSTDSGKLLKLIDSHLSEFDDETDADDIPSFSHLGDKIRQLESRQKHSDNSLPPSGSSKSVKCDVDEKYPENWSRDSSIDLNNVVNLPPVPEDVFSGFSSGQRPKRSSSLSSLKSMRKVKLFLQRAETSDDDDVSSDNEEHDLNHRGDSDDGGSPKKHLGNIKEEACDQQLLY